MSYNCKIDDINKFRVPNLIKNDPLHLSIITLWEKINNCILNFGHIGVMKP